MEIVNINSKREKILLPLLEWRILGVDELGEMSSYGGNARNLKKLICRVENDGILNSFIHKYSNKKFVYLSRKGFREFSNKSWNIHEDIKMHDAIVSNVLCRFSKLDYVSLSKINDQSIELNRSIFSNGVDPDGMIRAIKKNEGLNIAIEIELTRKSSSLIFEKFKTYAQDTLFDWAIYFFSSHNNLSTYFEYYNEFRNQNNITVSNAQIMFCYSDLLASNKLDLESCYWLRPDGVKSKLGELFL